eukprot:TRINITY_DN2154_c0_g1_i1.p1 TRINITY_DN2154_c0_g1~~TRINITY_DN2154_c0_g1_i1.p1  ORF type:complete len:587 (-),score=107.44 TRINITY_DN2154_c0_g1_i1:54-1736(-)
METIKQILLPTIATLIIIALFGITVPTTLFIATLIALTLISTLTSKPGYVRSTKSVQVDIVSNPMVQAFVSDCLELQEALPEEPSYERHAEVMRSLIRAGHLTVDDLKRSNSSRLFDIHRGGAFVLNHGLDVRVAVQLNLFGGSVANLGCPEQIEWLEGVWSRGELGCFCLTEAGAGVLSGLIVETTAVFDGESIIINSPTESSKKWWISQGLTAKWGVVIAQLVSNGIEHGIHAFIVDMKSEGVIIEDMNRKTDFNGLDNVSISFDNVAIPVDNMLSGISYLDQSGDYHTRDPNVEFNFVIVAQRLLSGRIGIAGASLGKLSSVVAEVEKFTSTRLLPTGRNKSKAMSEMPFIRDKLEEVKAMINFYTKYVIEIEHQYQTIETISNELVHRIACAKIEIVGYCITTIEMLKKKVGSFALFEHSPFGTKPDSLYVYRFAEGDSSVLQQKMVRDELKTFRGTNGLLSLVKSIPMSFIKYPSATGMQLALMQLSKLKLAITMSRVGRERMLDVWLENHELISNIARRMALFTIYEEVISKHSRSHEINVFEHRVLCSPLGDI